MKSAWKKALFATTLALPVFILAMFRIEYTMGSRWNWIVGMDRSSIDNGDCAGSGNDISSCRLCAIKA